MPGGRPPKPTALKVLQGNPGKRPLNKREPQPRAGVPRCPSWLTKDARTEWRRLVPELLRLGLLTAIDGAALAAYCQSWARFVEAERAISKHGAVVDTYYTDDDGRAWLLKTVPRPEVAISQRERQAMRAFMVGFGLDPASRTKISVSAAAVDPFEAFLTRGRGGA